MAAEGGGDCERSGVVVGVILDATRQYSSKLSYGYVSMWDRISCRAKLKHIRSLIPSHSPSCSAFLRPVMRLVLPHLKKSASFICPINACLHASALGDSSNFSVGGDAK